MTKRLELLSQPCPSGWWVWTAVAVAISFICAAGHDRSVTPAYRFGTERWFAGEPLYDMAGYGFVYHPQAALIYASWVFLPTTQGEIIWRCAMIGVLAGGVASLTRLSKGNHQWFLVTSIVSAAVGMGSISNGQATVMMSGLMMLACAQLSERCWNRAAILLMLAFACKPTSLILVLLVGAIFPSMVWRLAIAMCFLAVAPFLTQTPDYVVSQFVAFYQNSRVAYGDGETGYWAHLFGKFKVAGLHIPSNVQQFSRFVAGLTTLASCGILVRKLPPERSCFFLYAISTCYLMLFSPRVEGCTYVMIGPVYGCLLSDAWLRRQSRPASIGLLLAVVSTVFSFDLALLVTQKPNEVWLNPFVCLFVTGYIGLQVARELKAADVNSRTPHRQPKMRLAIPTGNRRSESLEDSFELSCAEQ